jgi:hypothetical protein
MMTLYFRGPVYIQFLHEAHVQIILCACEVIGNEFLGMSRKICGLLSLRHLPSCLCRTYLD